MAENNISSPVRIGIIGTGKMATKRHLPVLKRLEKEGLCTVVSICDIDDTALQNASVKFNIGNITHDPEHLVSREDIDAVCIFAPPDVHYKYGLKALINGKHLFVEKPPATTTDELVEMCILADSKNLVAVAGFNRRFQKNINEIKDRIDAESITTAEAFFHKPFSGKGPSFGMQSWLRDTGIHAIDTLCYVMGDRPTELYSVKNSDNNFSAIIKWNDSHAIFSVNNSTGIRLERYAFHGPGSFFVSEGENLTIDLEGKDRIEMTNAANADGGIYEEFKAFLVSTKKGIKPNHSLNKVISSLYLTELVESGYQGEIDWSFILGSDSNQNANKIDAAVNKTVDAPKNPSVFILNSEVIRPMLGDLSKRLTPVYESDIDSMSEEERKRVAVIITGGPKAKVPTKEHFEQFPSVSLLAVIGASVKKWGGEEALQRNITVLNTADTFAVAVAEFILMQAFIGLRKASVSHDVMRRGGWGFSDESSLKKFIERFMRVLNRVSLKLLRKRYFTVVSKSSKNSRMLYGKTLGIFGFGEITKKVIPLFTALGCKVIVNSEYLTADEARQLDCEKVSRSEVLTSDLVSIHRGLSARTEKFFDAQYINAMRPGTVFINSGRAGLVDNSALVERLKKGDIFACLDVFDIEPLNKHSEIRSLSNVFLTSHIAGSLNHIEELQTAAGNQLVEKIFRYLDGNVPGSVKGVSHLENMT